MTRDQAVGASTLNVGVPAISVIVKTLNEEARIARAIESTLRECEGINSELIVADSCSTDRTVEIACRYPVTVVSLEVPGERCCGIGPQLGYQHARGEMIYLLDGDMEFEPGFVRTAVNRLREDARLAAVAGTVIELGQGSYEFEYRRQLRPPMRPGHQRWLEMGGLYRREAVASVGYLSNRNLHANEEKELGLRLAWAGWRMERMAMPAVRHFGHNDTTLKLIAKRWRSRYVDGPGELLRASLGKPYFFEVVAQQGQLIAVAGGWFVTAGALLAIPWTVWPVEVIGALWVAAIAIQSVRKKSAWRGIQSILQLQVLAGGFVRGFLSKQVDPMTPVRSRVIKETQSRTTTSEFERQNH
jgi:GT2 family glycosyltransferase